MTTPESPKSDFTRQDAERVMRALERVAWVLILAGLFFCTTATWATVLSFLGAAFFARLSVIVDRGTPAP